MSLSNALRRTTRALAFAALIAWSQLTLEKRRLAAALAGVVIAVILMLMQLGIRDALFKSATLHYEHLQAELVMISSQHIFLQQTSNFSRRRLVQVLGVAGVEAVTPLYLGSANWKNPQTFVERPIFVLGFEPQSSAVTLPAVRSSLDKIGVPDVVLFDQASRPEYGAVEEAVRHGEPVKTEVSGRQIEVGGLFTLGTSFGIDGTLIASDRSFLQLFPTRRPGIIDLGLISLKPGFEPERVRAEIVAALPPDVRVLTKAELIQKEKDYWARNTPIGFVITMTVAVGLLVGAVILYQILYTDVTDHLAEFATLKAIGYSNARLFLVVFLQAIILALLAYPLAWVLSAGLYVAAHQATLLPISMTLARSLAIFGLTVLMCSASGFLAMQKLKSADPAEVF